MPRHPSPGMRPGPHRRSCPSPRPLAALLAVWAAAACAAPADPVWIPLPSGLSIEAVAESLATHGIVPSAEEFASYVRARHDTLEVEPGVYALRPGTSMRRVLDRLRDGRPEAVRLRVEPGVWVVELAPVLSRILGTPLDTVLAAARDSALRRRLGTTAETVEGYLAPGTYVVPVPATPIEVWRQLADAFETGWRPAWYARLDTLGLSRQELVTLASIIEGEGGDSSERALISSVYHNRLARGRRLEADPTVVYALGARRRLYNRHYAFDSPYNTYRVTGLPPGPVGQPSTASLLAALYPAETAFLYFVSTGEGRHVFSRSYREHLAAIRALRRR